MFKNLHIEGSLPKKKDKLGLFAQPSGGGEGSEGPWSAQPPKQVYKDMLKITYML